MENCLFCKIVRREVPAQIVYEDEDVLAFLDIKPVHEGHTLIVPKVHSDDLAAMDPVDLQAVYAAAQKVAQALLHLDADGVNITTNVKPAAGQVIFHTHIHVIPRYREDGLHLWPQHAYKEGASTVWQGRLAQLLK